MTSIKIKFRPSPEMGGEGMIFYQVIHDRVARRIASGYCVFPSEWDEKRNMVTTTVSSPRKDYVLGIRESVRLDHLRLKFIIRQLSDTGLIFTAEDISRRFNEFESRYSLGVYASAIITSLKRKRRPRTAETYRTAINSFMRFRKGLDITVDRITPDLMEEYEDWLEQTGVVANTISFYMRILRAIYHRAVEEGCTEDRRPFRRVYTGVDKTMKRSIPIELIKKIRGLDLSRKPNLDFARDMFMMSFCLRGMSLVDMAFLKKADLKNGYVSYRRRKTGQQLTVGWTLEMQKILDKYGENPTGYLLPIIRKPGLNERCAYHNTGYNINRSLKIIGKMASLPIALTLYVARHSWASAARANGIPVSVISEGMGHHSEATTRIYLSSLEASAIDQANSLILNSISNE